MKDVQNTKPNFNIPLSEVGITDFKLPIFIRQKDDGVQHSIATISAFINLDKNTKGISMSRIPIVLQQFSDKPISQGVISDIADKIINISNASECHLVYEFDYFIKKKAPISQEEGMVNYKVVFDHMNGLFSFEVIVEATSCCPCSKEISDFNSHNQRCTISITVYPQYTSWVWVEDIIAIAEQSASCDIYSVLKRPDEKVVTEKMYENAKFVEDINRECHNRLNQIEDIDHFIVKVQSDESIHQHKAFAMSIKNGAQ